MDESDNIIQDPSTPTRNLFGNFEILDTVGHGGMGIVYRAVDLSLGRPVALKVLREDLRRQSHLVARFQREAEAFASLNHPNIVHIYGVGTVGRIPYIAMEYIDGTPLSAMMKKERRIPWERALDYGEQVARALASAHDAQIIHRDIKPGNILIDKSGHAFVTDFGIAKVLTAETQLTIDGSRLGTPQYMSPERCLNQDVTASSDIYSLGVVIFQMITGRLPHEAPTPVRLIEHIIAKPPARVRGYVKEVPENVERLIAFMTEKNPKDRPADAHALCEAIARVRAGNPLDEGGDKAGTYASLRDEMGTPAPAKASHRDSFAKRKGAWLIQEWRKTKTAYRYGLGAAAVVGLSFAFSQTIVSVATRGQAFDVVRTSQGGVSRWGQSGAVASFFDEAPGMVLAQINLPEFEFGDACWADTSQRVALRLSGARVPGRTTQSILCAVEPESRRAFVAVSPLSGPPQPTGPALSLFSGTHGYDAGPGGGLLAFLVRASSSRDPAQAVPCIYAVPWESHGQAPVLLCDLGRPQHNVSDRVLDARTVGPIAINPVRGVVALAVSSDGVGWRVVEGRLGGAGAEIEWLTVVSWGAQVQALVYSRDGTRLACVRGAGRGADVLTVVDLRAGGYGQEMKLAEGGLTLGAGAFDPQGAVLAVGVEMGDGRSVLRLAPIDAGAAQIDLGEGHSADWLASGRGLVATVADNAGRRQLWTIEAEAPHARKQLTFLDTGTIANCYASPDGRWVLSAKADAFVPTLVLVDLMRLAPELTGVPSVDAGLGNEFLDEIEEGQVPLGDNQIGNDAPYDHIEAGAEQVVQ